MSVLTSSLERLGNEANATFAYLNSGGCCVFASFVARELASKGYRAKGVVVSYNSHAANGKPLSINEARKNVKYNSMRQWADNGVFFSHIGIEFQEGSTRRRYDSYGVIGAKSKLMGMSAYQGRLSVPELEDLSLDDNWNPTFDRNLIPRVEALVKKHLSDIPFAVQKSIDKEMVPAA